MTTKTQLLVVLEITNILLDCIRAAGPEGLPSGHLYARVMGSMSHETYERIIQILIDSGKIRREPSHLLVALPRKEVTP